jgi:hypothetical protein
MNVTTKKLLEVLKAKGYPLVTGERAATLVGIRATATDGDLFNDWLCCLVEKKVGHDLKIFPATTDCEAVFVNRPTGLQLPAGHYEDCWKLGVYKGRYYTLVGKSPLGINLCHGTPDPLTLAKHHWSGVEQVMKNIDEFHVVLNHLVEACGKVDRPFSYTLLDEADFG